MYILRYVIPIIPYIFFFIILLGLKKEIIFELGNYVKNNGFAMVFNEP